MLVNIGQFFLSISILVVLHELGHFTTAKWFKTKVEKFYVFVNFVLGIFLFSMILFKWGESYVDNNSLPYGIAVSEIGAKLGLNDGDKILKVGDRVFDKFNSGILAKELVINQAATIEVIRLGENHTINVNKEAVLELTKEENKKQDLISIRRPYEIGEVYKDSPAEKAGLKVGDEIVNMGGVHLPFAHMFENAMRKVKVPSVILSVKRQGGNINLKVQLDEEGKMGIRPMPITNYVKLERQKYDFGESVIGGWDKSWTFLSDQAKAFGLMASGKIRAKDSLGGPISIGKMFGPVWDWQRFWTLTASLSILLGFLNLLPIPALDGGYVMFLLWETITGRKVSDNVMEKATMVGFLLLMILMIYAFGLDISKLF